MHAIILAAGQGNRLAEFNPDGRPKCLLEFAGQSLLARQLDSLFRLGVTQSTMVIGYEADRIIEHVGTLSSRPQVAFAYNPAFKKGSVLSLLAAQEVMAQGEMVLILDADVMFHPQIMQRLVGSATRNCLLLDRNFIPGDEPAKIALFKGEIVEFRKMLADDLRYDLIGESIGFFKFSGEIAAKIAQTCARYRSEGLLDAPYEETLRDVLLADPGRFACVDVSGLPWLEIDYPQDIEHAIKQVLPAIRVDVPDF